jgi:hypothetical protein
MARSGRKAAAAKFRDAIARSNEVHRQYLADADLLESYDRFTRWQLDYMLSFFDDLIEAHGYKAAVDFIISDLAGVGVAERDRDIQRAGGVIASTLPTHPLETAAAALELNAAALEINLSICRRLLVDGRLPEHISEADYIRACRAASTYEECMGLVRLAGELGQTLKTLVRVPLLGGLLRTMRAPAHAAGFGALQEFLETGFNTFREIPDIDLFLEQLVEGLDKVFQRIYQLPVDETRKG